MEQTKKGGIIARKNISPEALGACFMTSRYDTMKSTTPGFYRKAVSQWRDRQTSFLLHPFYPELHADMTYFGTEYPHFSDSTSGFRLK